MGLMSGSLKRAPLFAAHQKLGGKLIEFGGWEMPVQYTTIIDEHLAVRKAAGIFDISHMGELLVSGVAAEEFLNHVLTNDIRRLEVGQGQYTLMCNERGGTIDDLYAYRFRRSPDVYLLIVNASRVSEDLAWLQKQRSDFSKRDFVAVEDRSDKAAAVAVQGPAVAGFINDCFQGASVEGTPVARVSELRKNQIARFDFPGRPVWVSRTGYTGEDGFEVVATAAQIEAVWNKVLEAGSPFGLKPCGLGARDTLRTEVCYPLYGHELDERTTPIEAGLGFFVALDKPDFIGRAVLADQKAGGTTRKCMAFKMTDKSAPPRPHYPIWMAGDNSGPIGEVASGTQSPSLGVGIGMGYVRSEFAKAQTAIEIEIRGKRCPALIVPRPIYRKPD